MPIEGENFAAMSPNMSTLQMYKPLSKDRYANGLFPFRLARLLPGTGSDNICVDLTLEVSGDANTEPYEAVSYVWGSTSEPIEVTVNVIDAADDPAAGKRVTGRFLITQNLYSALHHLRHPNRGRALWVDALCINQADDDEKSEQVSRMAEVYRRAQRVVVWMGPEGHQCSLTLKTLETMGSHMEVEWGTYVARPKAGHSVHSLVSLESWAAVVNFLYRDWFERMWVQQEISVAHTAIIMCGHTVARWNEVKMAIFYLLSQGGHEDPGGGGRRRRRPGRQRAPRAQRAVPQEVREPLRVLEVLRGEQQRVPLPLRLPPPPVPEPARQGLRPLGHGQPVARAGEGEAGLLGPPWRGYTPTS